MTVGGAETVGMEYEYRHADTNIILYQTDKLSLNLHPLRSASGYCSWDMPLLS